MRLLSAFVRRRQWGGEVYSCVGVFFEKIFLSLLCLIEYAPLQYFPFIILHPPWKTHNSGNNSDPAKSPP